MSTAQFLTSYLPSIYYYLIFSVILVTFFTIIKDRKLFPANSRGVLLLLSVIQVFLGSYLFIRSFGNGSRRGSGVVLPDGTFIADPQPILYAIDDILFYLNTPQLAAVGINSRSNFKRENIMKIDGRIKACKPLCLQNKIPHGAMCEV